MRSTGRQIRRLIRPARRGTTAAGMILATALAHGGCGDSTGYEHDQPPARVEADSAARYVRTDTAEPAIVAAVEPAPRPTAPLAEGASCVTARCHAGFVTAKQVHGPVGAGSCRSCHEPDTGNHTYPLSRPADQLCTFCHTVTGTRRHEHKALADGCRQCHNPHASQAKFLLTEPSVDRLCAHCHDLPVERYAHGPFAEGQCTLCHRPHQSDAPALLRGGEGMSHCLSCHQELGLALQNSPIVHKPAAESCTICHQPHSSPYPKQLNASIQSNCFGCHESMAKYVVDSPVAHDALFTADRCVNCHDPHAAGRPNLLRSRADRLCLQCHDKPVTASDGRTIPDMKPTLSRRYLHGPVRSGDCTACHNAHGSSNERLLSQMYPKAFYASFDLSNYALCFRCHEKDLVLKPKTTELTDFRNGDVNLHYLHVHRQDKGRTCKTCHAIHGSDQPKHVAATVPFEGSAWPMPIGFEREKDGGRCAPGCHEPMRYQRGAAAPADRSPPTGGAP